ncbi:MAG: hypothetical protein ABI373_03735, partial [Flavobacteriales bacterium]
MLSRCLLPTCGSRSLDRTDRCGHVDFGGCARTGCNFARMRLTHLLRYMMGSEEAFELKEQLILRDHLA